MANKRLAENMQILSSLSQTPSDSLKHDSLCMQLLFLVRMFRNIQLINNKLGKQ